MHGSEVSEMSNIKMIHEDGTGWVREFSGADARASADAYAATARACGRYNVLVGTSVTIERHPNGTELARHEWIRVMVTLRVAA
jgi:hypothetical protein